MKENNYPAKRAEGNLSVRPSIRESIYPLAHYVQESLFLSRMERKAATTLGSNWVPAPDFISSMILTNG